MTESRFIVCEDVKNPCDAEGNISNVHPSWRTYDMLMLLMMDNFMRAEGETSAQKKMHYKKLERLYGQKANEVLNALKK